jgi:Cytochrome P460
MMRLLVPLFTALLLTGQTISSDAPQFTGDGQLILPAQYREWVYLSSGLGMTYGPAAQADQGNPMFDNVFVSRSAYKAFLESGHWPDKTILILEIRRSVEKGSINNGGHYQTDVLQLEAAVKDESRFPQKWAYFGFGRGDKAAPLPATSGCNSCHSQNAAVENTFVQFYPALLEIATHKGTLNPKYLEKSKQAEPH